MVIDKPSFIFETLELIRRENNSTNEDSLEETLKPDFNPYILHEIRTDFPQKIPAEIGDFLHLKNKTMEKLSPNPPYISYDLGSKLVRHIQSTLPKDKLTFSLLNTCNHDKKNENIINFIKKFNINATNYKSKKINKILQIFNKNSKKNSIRK